MNVFKNFLRLATFVALIFAVACTKEDISTDLFSDDATVALNELVASGTGSGGPGTDSTHTNGGGHGGRHWKGGHGDHPGHAKGDSIAFSGLPLAAQTYLIANTDTSKLVRIAKITLKDSTIRYAVRLSNGKHYHFDASGALVATPMDNHKFTEITFAELPAAAQTYVLSKTTAANISMVIKITKPDGTIVYGVRLADNTHYAFDAAGAVLPERARKKKH